MIACANPWCRRPAKVRGFCIPHYDTWRRSPEFVPLDRELMSATELVRDIDGLSYRMLDYWIRTGRVTIVNDAHGSGNARRFLPHEVAAIRDVVARIQWLETEMCAAQSGEYYAERLAHHQSEATAKVGS